MARIKHYQQLVEQVLTQYLELSYANADIHNEPIFNHETGQYVVMSSGWQGARRIHGCLLHLKIQMERYGSNGMEQKTVLLMNL